MDNRGREPIKDRPQKELDPKDRNSRLFAFRVNRASGDANDMKVRAICDRWVTEGVFPEMIKKGVLLADGSEPVTNQELSRVLMRLSRDQKETIEQLQVQIDSLHQLIRYLANNERRPIQEIQQETGSDFPAGFLDNVLSNFDE